MDEKEMLAKKNLEEIVENYILIIDTCSLLQGQATELFWEHIIPILRDKKKKILMPYKCWDELKKHFQSQNNELSQNALNAMTSVKRYQEEGYLEAKKSDWEKDSIFADNTFKTVFNMYRDRFSLLLITQDSNLAKEIVALNDSKAVKGEQVWAKRINKYGYLSDFFWNEQKSAEENKSIKPQYNKPIEKSNAFAVFSKVTDIPADPIKVTYIPKENDTVITKNGKLQLIKKIAAGGEGIIYETSDSDCVAKIYLDSKLTKRTFEKLKIMIGKDIRCDGICFPIMGVYNERKEFVGYLMQKAKGERLAVSVFNKLCMIKKFPAWKKKDVVQLGITILEKIQYLHEKNIILGDINGNNFMVVSPTEVYFIDTDSYQIEDFPCPVGVPTFTPPEIASKNYKDFLRSMGNENFSIAVLMFMLLMGGKLPYSQKNGDTEDIREKNEKMDFSFPCGDKSNKKTPEGSWGFMWSHLLFKIKEAFYETFNKGGKYSTERTRLSADDWIFLFKQYYYELTQGDMLKNDEMSGELFPNRLKKNPNANYIRCKICNAEIDDKFAKNGICNSCLRLSVGKCKKCGGDLDFTNYDKYIKNLQTPDLCRQCYEEQFTVCTQCGKKVPKSDVKNGLCVYCQRNLTYITQSCSVCGNRFDITFGEKEFYESKGLEMPKKCQYCRKNNVVSNSQNFQANYRNNSNQNQAGQNRNRDDKLKKKRDKAISEINNIYYDKLIQIVGIHPIRKSRLKDMFVYLKSEVSRASNSHEIDNLVKKAYDYQV